MNVIGIIAEYDPFHLGHQHQCRMLRKSRDAVIVAVMGGNFNQRGFPARWEKYCRAQAAVLGGVDLVLELPYPFSCASAPWFARAGVEILDRLGVCDGISFGCERENAETLQLAAQRIYTPSFLTALEDTRRKERSSGIPALRAKLYEEMYGEALPETPNDMLAVEYFAALAQRGSALRVYPVHRSGDYHREHLDGALPSASAVRAAVLSGQREAAAAAMPRESAACILDAPRAQMQSGERAILWHFANADAAQIDALCDIPAGCGARMVKAAREADNLTQFLQKIGSKQYTAARTRRMMWNAFFGVTPERMESGCEYTAVLGANARGRALLREIRAHAQIPVYDRPAAGEGDMRDLGRKADGFYALLLGETVSAQYARTAFMAP